MNKAELIAYMLDKLPDFTPEVLNGYAASDPLTGDSGVLDSLGLVTFCFEVEQWASQAAGVRINLVNDRLLAEEPSPFRTLDAMADAVLYQVKDSS